MRHLDEELGNATVVGRRELAEWEQAQADNYFSADKNSRQILEMYWGTHELRQQATRLFRFGGVAATEVDRLARTIDLAANLPILNRFDGIGRRIESVDFHPDYHAAGRHIYDSGVMSVLKEPGNTLLSLALFYLSSQNGEAGHNCPLACTAGAIKVLQAAGSEDLKETYLGRLLDPNYDHNFHAAQFLTEVQGGSDVGANSTHAAPTNREDGAWLINGEKWFCSNVTAEVILMTARVPGQGKGTRGLGLFLVPRQLKDGSLNSFTINRLKDKLGTRSMASGEVLFQDTVAYPVGDVDEGFRHVMQYVINTSRIFNAIGTTGNARRAYLVASSYARHRRAFGHEIMRFPLVQAQLAEMRADVAAMLGGSFRIAHLIDQAETGKGEIDDGGFLRVALNLNKFRSAVLAHHVILTAIELLGGNGAIESFSVLPRLLRDNVVYENWEGTHNVLLAQVQRDMRRYQVQEPFVRTLRRWLHALRQPAELKQQLDQTLTDIEAELEHVLGMDELTAAIYFRPLMVRLTDLYYAICLAVEAEWTLVEKQDRVKQRLAVLFANRRAFEKQAKDIPYYDDQVARLALE